MGLTIEQLQTHGAIAGHQSERETILECSLLFFSLWRSLLVFIFVPQVPQVKFKSFVLRRKEPRQLTQTDIDFHVINRERRKVE